MKHQSSDTHVYTKLKLTPPPPKLARYIAEKKKKKYLKHQCQNVMILFFGDARPPLLVQL